MSYRELAKIAMQPWSSVNDIKAIANCGRDQAAKIRNNIIEDIKKTGKDVLPGKTILVPTKKVLEALDLDADYIINMANLEINFMVLDGRF